MLPLHQSPVKTDLDSTTKLYPSFVEMTSDSQFAGNAGALTDMMIPIALWGLRGGGRIVEVTHNGCFGNGLLMALPRHSRNR